MIFTPNKINMKTFKIICVLLISLCGMGQSDESAEAASAADYYAKYYHDYYNNIAGI